MVVIKKRSNIIPVDFGEFQLEFRANDDNIKRMHEVGDFLMEKGEKLKETDGDQALEALRDTVKEAWVEFFDEEAYQKVYEFSDHTTTDTLFYLIETIKGVVGEWESRHAQDKLAKYLE